jgi:catechol 2,3-dioxygenase
MSGTSIEFREMDTTIPDRTRLGRTALTVNNLGGMTEFYETIVGLEVIRRDDGTAVLGAGETPLLVLEEDATAGRQSGAGPGLYHNAFRVPTRSAFADAFVRVENNWQRTGGYGRQLGEVIYLTDPEGNGVEIYWDRQREEWPLTEDGDVALRGMTQIPLPVDELKDLAPRETHMPRGTDLGHIHLHVPSAEAAEAFYGETLGFGITARMNNAAFFAAGDYHHHIGTNTWNNPGSLRTGRGLSWFEIIVPDETSLTAVRTD